MLPSVIRFKRGSGPDAPTGLLQTGRESELSGECLGRWLSGGPKAASKARRLPACRDGCEVLDVREPRDRRPVRHESADGIHVDLRGPAADEENRRSRVGCRHDPATLRDAGMDRRSNDGEPVEPGAHRVEITRHGLHLVGGGGRDPDPSDVSEQHTSGRRGCRCGDFRPGERLALPQQRRAAGEHQKDTRRDQYLSAPRKDQWPSSHAS